MTDSAANFAWLASAPCHHVVWLRLMFTPVLTLESYRVRSAALGEGDRPRDAGSRYGSHAQSTVCVCQETWNLEPADL